MVKKAAGVQKGTGEAYDRGENYSPQQSPEIPSSLVRERELQ